MQQFKKISSISGLLVFLISLVVFYHSVERTGSLWDCGEFILGAYKLQVVHPPGAGLFLIIGRIFAWIATLVSDNPSDIAFAVNLMSGICTSVAGMMIAWTTIMFGKLALLGREGEPSNSQNIALGFAGLAAGLATTFSTSIWFSAVEGEVYAMSTMFTTMTLWAATKYYFIEDRERAYRWLVLSLFVSGMSVGVHLMSILSLPAIILLVYFKEYKNHTVLGSLLAMGVGVGLILFVMKGVIVGIPSLWKNFEVFMVNSLGMPFHTGLIPTIILLIALCYFGNRYVNKLNNVLIQVAFISAIFISIAFSTVGVVVIRAAADTPINMNVPDDALRLLPYLNREQYGERPLVNGPHYEATPVSVDRSDRMGRVGKRYEVVDEKYEYIYAQKDKIFFPRIGHTDRPEIHRMWREALNGNSKGKPGMGYNLQFLWNYQLNWMYWRYFMWNFAGRQSADQGYYPWDLSKGHWKSGITPIDEGRLYNMDALPDTMKYEKSANNYYFLPLIFGFLGLVFHYNRRRKDFLTLLVLFLITGIGIIIYSNQPPNEPRERDYVLVGSFMTFCIWIGMGVLALYQIISKKIQGMIPALLSGLLVLSAPVIMAFENFDDHSRKHHLASRDYANNFLNSLEPNAIIFTYGDNDTYPLWYAQEVEGIRRDVRVVNLSLIAVDWYINKLRNKVNDSEPIKLTLSEEQYRGKNRNQIYFANPGSETLSTEAINVFEALRRIGDDRNNIQGQSYINSRSFYIPVDREKYSKLPFHPTIDSSEWVDRVLIQFPENSNYFLKDDLAVIDLIASNFYERPIYFALTVQASKLIGLGTHVEQEGLALRITPTNTRSKSPFGGIYGAGDINLDRVYNNIMTKWKWGNFDKMDLYVDKSYLAAVQSMKLTFLRAAIEFDKLENKEKAIEIIDKYFEVFPHMNFPYDMTIINFINIYIKNKEFEKAKTHLDILANETEQYLRFYESQSKQRVIESFESDYRSYLGTAQDIIRIAAEMEDPEYKAKIETLLKNYIPSQNLEE